MAKNARLLDIFVAGPSDTSDQKALVKEVVDAWNRDNSRNECAFLHLHTGDDVAPSVSKGKTGQSVIDQHIVEDLEVEILIAIFKKRLGTTYRGAPSATAHELGLCEEKGAMCSVYFSKEEEWKSVEIEEAARLREFETALIGEDSEDRIGGLVGYYQGLEDLRRQLRVDIHTKVRALLAEADEAVAMIKEQTEFDPIEDQRRLVAQADFMKALDNRVLKAVLKELRAKRQDTVRVLDAGCAEGYVTLSRFSRHEGITLVGIDRNEDAIKLASQSYDEQQKRGTVRAEMRFMALSIEQYHKTGETFDLVFTALTLHHVGDSSKVLAMLWDMVAPGGALVVRASDDASKIHWPDYGGGFADFVRRANASPGSSDREYGRKLYSQACDLNPRPERMSMDFQVVSTVGMTDAQRADFFLVNHSYRPDAAGRHARRPGASRVDWAEARGLIEMRDQFRKRFEREDDFFSMTAHNALVGWKPE